ncbi:Bcr/CflA family multidrug efflux MFS transporter [Terasakiella sp. A23]|uniref:Bcr/CflA family multidrug efflux MFS transporter n=1 Tax=Terasakiella sp. FCG-A23 TaxID=3080561 RepID=UPI002954A753|nr:Bcr/CflA family multidrug efflux MFS transporter [Terasakiella sp. A23]MDV7340600.1 Bcr/CflA family multidrug efflux MFS transporter [Terasakiella sp. A23]
MSASPRLSVLAIPILAVMTGNAALSLDMYLPAFPSIANDLGVAESAVQQTMATFLFGFAFGQMIYGPLSDSLGRRTVILIGLTLYGLISTFCALSTDIHDLTFYRLIQGLAGASGSVLGRAVIRDVYHGPELTKALSLLMLVLTAAPMAAPLIGAAVLDIWDWRAIFWTLSAYACLWCFLIILFVPETLAKDKRVTLNLSFLITATREVLSHKQAMGYILSASLGFAGMFAYITATPFIYMNIFGIKPSGYALFFAANILSMAIFSFFNRRIASHTPLPKLMIYNIWVLIISAVVLLFNSIMGIGGVWGLAIPLFFFVGCLSPMAANGISGTLEPFGKFAGTASSIFGLFQFGLGSLSGFLVSLLNDGTQMPMAYIIFGCAVLSVMVFTLSRKGS